jgi:hypothetical protein
MQEMSTNDLKLLIEKFASQSDFIKAEKRVKDEKVRNRTINNEEKEIDTSGYVDSSNVSFKLLERDGLSGTSDRRKSLSKLSSGRRLSKLFKRD